jgi:hypothetical protein
MSQDSMSQTKQARFSDMDLRIGQTVQMILRGPVEHKYFTRLIGYVEPEFMMLQVPTDHGWLASVREGQSLAVRLFSGVSLFEFDTHITALLLNPRNYLLLAFPKEVRETRIRAHERVAVRLPIDIISAPVGKAVAGARLKDLSGGGAAVWASMALGEAGQRLLLGLNFDLKATGSHERVQMAGTLKSVQAQAEETTKSPGFLHGVQFDSVEPRILLLTNELPRGRSG